MTRSQYPKQEDRTGMDHRWNVASWRVPSDVPPVPREDGTPAWWRGDEDASQSFLREMGVS